MAGDSVIYDFGQDLLAAAVAGLAADHRPDRQVVVFAKQYAIDCASVIVQYQRTYTSRVKLTGAGGDRPTPRGGRPGVRVAQYEVCVAVECAPQSDGLTAPSDAAVNAFSERVLTDGYDVWRALKIAVGDTGDAPTITTPCQGAEVGDATADESGGFGWVKMPVLIEF